MKRFFAILLSVALLSALMSSCAESVELDYLTKQEITGSSSNVKAPHALLFYFVGTSLDSYFGRNISAVKSVVDGNILDNNRIAYFRRTSGSTWAITEIYYDPASGSAVTEVLKTYEDADLSHMEVYLSDMVNLVPAESYGIVFGGHGSGWLPADLGSGWSSNYSQSAARRSSAPQYINPFGEAPREGALPTRFFGETGAMFDVDAIAENMISAGVKFDYIIFDDCYMSNIESLYALRHATDYIIASPCEIMAEGFPYKYVIPSLFGGSKPDLEGVCRSFYEYYLHESGIPSGCVALTVCSELDALAEAYRNIVTGPTATVDISQLQYYEGMSRHLFYDFGQYVEKLSVSSQQLEEFRVQFDRTFPESCRLHTPRFYTVFGSKSYIDVDYYSGVTISEPADRNVELNRQTDWYRATH